MILDYELVSRMLFFDIETVAEYRSYAGLPPLELALWDKISKRYLGDNFENATLEEKIVCYKDHSGLFPEFSKVVSVSYGVVKVDLSNVDLPAIDVRPIIDNDEKTILTTFATVLNYAYSKNIHRVLAGHNIAGFDIPFIVKRMIKNGIQVPTILVNIIEAKPWEQKIYDTIRVWKFGGSEFVSLESVCVFLGVETPKVGVVTGKSLNQYYYSERDINETLENISKYNQADVLAVIKVVLRLAKH